MWRDAILMGGLETRFYMRAWFASQSDLVWLLEGKRVQQKRTSTAGKIPLRRGAPPVDSPPVDSLRGQFTPGQFTAAVPLCL